jgi:hypothetical protein
VKLRGDVKNGPLVNLSKTSELLKHYFRLWTYLTNTSGQEDFLGRRRLPGAPFDPAGLDAGAAVWIGEASGASAGLGGAGRAVHDAGLRHKSFGCTEDNVLMSSILKILHIS